MSINDSVIVPLIKRLYQIQLLREITSGNSGDRIFEVESTSGQSILRVSAFSEKKQAHTEFETRWIEYLAAQIEGIAKPVRSANNNLYEVISADGKAYILSLQVKAQGKIIDINDPQEFNEGLFYRLGMLMGQVHKLTMRYDGNNDCPEFKWNGPNCWRGNIAIMDEDVRRAEKRLQNELEQLPVEKDSYGIVHYDIHTDNFLVADNRITLIDFDACQFNWYAADVASALFFMVLKGAGPLKNLTEKERTKFAEMYLLSYLKGYRQSNQISAYWIGKLDLFMRYQMVDEYVAAELEWRQNPSSMSKGYLDWHRDRIANNASYVFIDYKKVLDIIRGI